MVKYTQCLSGFEVFGDLFKANERKDGRTDRQTPIEMKGSI